jgi:hypothetical protein
MELLFNEKRLCECPFVKGLISLFGNEEYDDGECQVEPVRVDDV